MRQTARQRVEVNLEELDRIIESGMSAPLTKAEGQKLKAALHALEERITRKRSTEKTRAVLNQPTGGADEEQSADASAPAGHGRNSAAAFAGATKVFVPHATLQPGHTCPECHEGIGRNGKAPFSPSANVWLN